MDNIDNIIESKIILFKNEELNKKIELFSIFYKSDNLIVQGYVLQKKNLSKKVPIIIFCRGGNRTYGEVKPNLQVQRDEFIQLAENEKAIIFFPNYRGSSMSEGEDELCGKDVNDIISLYNIFEKYKYCDIDKIALYGWSRGGMMAIKVATMVPWVKTIILRGSPYSMMRLAIDRPKMGTLYKEQFNLTESDIM